MFALRRTAKTVRFRALAIVSTLFALRTSARSCLSCSGVQGARGVPVISPSPLSSSSTQPPGVLSSPKVDASRIPHSGNCQISLAVPHAFPFASGFPRGRSRSSASTPGCEQRIWCAAFALRSRPCCSGKRELAKALIIIWRPWNRFHFFGFSPISTRRRMASIMNVGHGCCPALLRYLIFDVTDVPLSGRVAIKPRQFSISLLRY